MRLTLVVVLLSCAGCIKDTRPSRDRFGAVPDNVPEIAGPKADRCAGHGTSAAKARCDEAKYLAETYVHKLAAGDEICLEGGFGDVPTGACLTRAKVEDADAQRVLVEVLGAKPDSRWFRRESNQFWFLEGALVDLYLADHGY